MSFFARRKRIKSPARGSAKLWRERHLPRLELLEARVNPGVVVPMTFTVTTPLDENDGTLANPAGPDGKLSLREAVIAANNNAAADTIIVPAGLYRLTMGQLDITGNVTIQGAGPSLTVVDGNQLGRVYDVHGAITVTIQNMTIQGGLTGGHGAAIALEDAGATLTVTGSVIKNNTAGDFGGGIFAADSTTTPAVATTRVTLTGDTLAANLTGHSGGGVFMGAGGSLTVDGSTFSDNRAYDEGGAIDTAKAAGGAAATGAAVQVTNSVFRHNIGSSGGGIFLSNSPSLMIDGSTFTDNRGSHSGGAIASDNNLSGNHTLQITNTSMLRNTASSGGAMLISDFSSLTIDHCTISDNSSTYNGGGIWLSESNATNIPAGTATVSNSTITNNISGDGGGLYVRDDTGTAPSATFALMITGCTISGNTATLSNTGTNANQNGGGGGIDVIQQQAGGTFTVAINSSVVSGNHATENGAGVNFTVTSGVQLLATLTNVTMSGNSAAGNGGGIFGSRSAATAGAGAVLTLTNVTDAGNAATSGGGVFIDANSTAKLQNTIVASSRAGNNFAGAGVYMDLKNNLSSDASGAAFLTDASDFNNTDPKLGPLQFNGGPMFTQALLTGSPAIDHGADGITTADARGVARPQGVHADIGAFEYVVHAHISAVSSPVPGQDTVISVSDADTGKLLYKITPFPGFPGEVRFAVGDVNGDGVPDIAAAAGPSGGPHVRVFNGKDGTPLVGAQYDFMALDPAFRGGLFIAVGQFDSDPKGDLVVAADAGGGPQVQVFSGADGHVIASFYTYNPIWTGGVRVAAADVDGDGRDDLITGAGPGGGPHVETFSGVAIGVGVVDFEQANATMAPHVLDSFYAFRDPNYKGGIYVAGAELNGQLAADIVVGKGETGNVTVNGNPVDVEIVDGAALTRIDLNPYPGLDVGVRVGTLADVVDNDSLAEIMLGPGPGGANAQVKVIDGDALMLNILQQFGANPQSPSSGVWVGGH
jgi:predicted outer membrane repeat protein